MRRRTTDAFALGGPQSSVKDFDARNHDVRMRFKGGKRLSEGAAKSFVGAFEVALELGPKPDLADRLMRTLLG